MSLTDSLHALEKEASLIESIAATLHWDQQCNLPHEGGAYRGEQLAYLAKIKHEKSTSDKLKAVISELEEQQDLLSPTELRSLQLARRNFDANTKLPAKLVETLAHTTSQAQKYWSEARQKNDDTIFLPHLEKIINLAKEKAKCLAYDKDNIYNNLLSQFNWGLTCSELDETFGELGSELPKLANKIISKGIFKDSMENQKVSIPEQEKMGQACLKLMGFDPQKCNLSVAPHPFCLTLGPSDFRITTRYSENNFASSYLATAHEMGHSLYEQGLPKELYGTPIGGYCSLGVHESQSLFWEKKVAASREFLQLLWPSLQKTFAKEAPHMDLEKLYYTMNHVKNSLIRVDADEVTYCLHVVIRYEMEKLIINEDLAASDIREAWDKKYQEYLGIVAPEAKSSFIQDVHWAWGEFGYFPSYALGHLISSQFEEKMVSELAPISELVATNRIHEITAWLRTNIHQEAYKNDPAALVKKASGQALSTKPFLNYLEKKFLI